MSGQGNGYDDDVVEDGYVPIGSELSDDYTSLNIEPKPLRPHILAAATIVFGDDYYSGQRETISLSGFVQLNKWPMPGFNHRIDEKGRATFDLELISAPEVGIKGYSYHLNDRIQVLSNPLLPNTGYVRQIVPGQNFPAHFHIRRFGILETSKLRLAHRNVIEINGVVDGIPPYKAPLTPPLLGAPIGDGPCDVIPAPNTVRGTNLPEAWYPANAQNQAQGITPTVFFAPSAGPCISTLVDPSRIVQSTTEGAVVLDVNGKTETVELVGSHAKAAGVEILLFDSAKTGVPGVLAQLARTAILGESPALGGRIMLRASFFKVSGGTVGDGWEESVNELKYPADLHLDAHLEIVTPNTVLYAVSPVHIFGRVDDMSVTGTEMAMLGGDVAMADAGGNVRARLSGVTFRLTDAVVGEQAYVTA